MDEVAAVVLAAGRGTRMGGGKLALPWGDGTILDAVLHTLEAAGIQEIVVVLATGSGELAEAAGRAGARCVVNEERDRGMLSSVQCGLRALMVGPEGEVGAPPVVPPWTGGRWSAAAGPPGERIPPSAVTAAVIVPGDHPAFRAETVVRLLAHQAPGAMVIPTFGGRRGHPILLGAGLFEAVFDLDHEVGLRQLCERRPECVRYVEVDDPGVVADIDTPADYARWRHAGGAGVE